MGLVDNWSNDLIKDVVLHLDKSIIYLSNKYQEVSVERYQGISEDRYLEYLQKDIGYLQRDIFFSRTLFKKKFSLELYRAGTHHILSYYLPI